MICEEKFRTLPEEEQKKAARYFIARGLELSSQLMKTAGKIIAVSEKLHEADSGIFVGDLIQTMEKICMHRDEILAYTDALTLTVLRNIVPEESPLSGLNLGEMQESAKAFGMDSFYKNGRIYLKMPILPTKKETIRMNSSGQAYLKYYGKSFESAVMYEVEKLGLPDRTREMFRRKKVTYLFVFPELDFTNPYKITVPDPDNFDTKRITDAAVYHLGGDKACSCELQYLAEATDRIPRGTYLILTPGAEKFSEKESILAAWESHLASPK